MTTANRSREVAPLPVEAMASRSTTGEPEAG